MNHNRFSGCFWIFLFLLLLGGPRLLGWLFFFVVSLLLIALFFVILGGHFIFRNVNISEYLKSQTEAHNLFGTYLTNFMVLMAKADGKADEKEIALIKAFFRESLNYRPQQMYWVDKLIKDALHSTKSVDDLASEFNLHFGINEKRILIYLLYQIALVDGIIEETEQNLINRIVLLIGLEKFEHDSIKHMFSQKHEKENPYHILGITADASAEEIKKRYRDLCKEFHPDKVSHLGEEFKKKAEEKMAKINHAYDILKKNGKI